MGSRQVTEIASGHVVVRAYRALLLGLTISSTLALSGCHSSPTTTTTTQKAIIEGKPYTMLVNGYWRTVVADGVTVKWSARAESNCWSGNSATACQSVARDIAPLAPQVAFSLWKRGCDLDLGNCFYLSGGSVADRSSGLFEEMRKGRLSAAQVQEFRDILESACHRTERVENSAGRDDRTIACLVVARSYVLHAPREARKAAALIAYNCSTFGSCWLWEDTSTRCKSEHVDCDIVAVLPKSFDAGAAERIRQRDEKYNEARIAEVETQKQAEIDEADASAAAEQAERQQMFQAVVGGLQAAAASASRFSVPRAAVPMVRTANPAGQAMSLPEQQMEAQRLTALCKQDPTYLRALGEAKAGSQRATYEAAAATLQCFYNNVDPRYPAAQKQKWLDAARENQQRARQLQ